METRLALEVTAKLKALEGVFQCQKACKISRFVNKTSQLNSYLAYINVFKILSA
jgi:hypothetical protein